MDHLQLPQDVDPLSIQVPFLAQQCDQYDGFGFDDFPLRRTYTSDKKGTLTFRDLRQRPTTEVLSFVQAWLYFGLLYEVLGSLFCQDDYISRDGGGLALSTTKLPSVLRLKRAQRFEYPQWLKIVFWFRLLGTTILFNSSIAHHRQRVESEENRIGSLLKAAALQCDRIDLELDHADWPTILLSIRILIHTVHLALLGQDTKHHDAHNDQYHSLDFKFPHHDAPSLRSIRNHMLRKGSAWCPLQFRVLLQKLSCTSLFYVANLKRQTNAWVDHSNCEPYGSCIGYNIDNESFQHTHVEAACNCADVEAPLRTMYDILRGGQIPVVKCRQNDDGEFSLSYVRAAPGASYTAISHLWSDGLGNPNANSIPWCQLQRLFTAVTQSDHAIARHGPRLGRSHGRKQGWQEYAGMLVRSLYRMLLGKFRFRQPKYVYFWLDVYCVPVAIPSVLRNEEAQYLKSLALNKMTTTYSWANYVMVLDHEFGRIDSQSDFSEFACRIAMSGWNSRFWTYQEYCMARTLVYLGGDGPKLTHDIGMNGSLGSALSGIASSTDDNSLRHLSDLQGLLFRRALRREVESPKTKVTMNGFGMRTSVRSGTCCRGEIRPRRMTYSSSLPCYWT